MCSYQESRMKRLSETLKKRQDYSQVRSGYQYISYSSLVVDHAELLSLSSLWS